MKFIYILERLYDENESSIIGVYQNEELAEKARYKFMRGLCTLIRNSYWKKKSPKERDIRFEKWMENYIDEWLIDEWAVEEKI